jgi:DNA-binding CsgD family transcriptional regulator
VAEGDADALDEVAERFAAMGARLHAAEAAAAAAEAHGAEGRRWRQTTSWAVATNHAARCEGAMTPLLAQLSQDPTVTLLTVREREVVELAARRLTNRQIADVLGLSVRTVHSHLNHAYAKLGIADRSELAALVHLASDADDSERPAPGGR